MYKLIAAFLIALVALDEGSPAEAQEAMHSHNPERAASLSDKALAKITAEAFASWDTTQTASGETGVIPLINRCYEALGNTPTQAEAARCISIDYLGYTLASYTSQYMHVSLNDYFQKNEYQVRVYEAVSHSTPPPSQAAFLRAVIKSTDRDFGHWYDTHPQ